MLTLYSYSMLSSMTTTLIFSLVFLFLSKQNNKFYLRLWGFSWFLYSLIFLIDFIRLQGLLIDTTYLPLRQVFALLGSYHFLLGTHHFFQLKPSPLLNVVTFIAFISIVICPFSHTFYIIALIPNIILCSGLLIISGCMFISYSWTQNSPEKISASFLIILWAFFINHFGFTINHASIAVTTYFIAVCILTMLILLLMIIYFKKALYLDSKQSQRFRLLVENSSDCMFLYNYKTHNFEYASPLINSLIGISPHILYTEPERFFDYIETLEENKDILNIFKHPIKVSNKGILCRIKNGRINSWIEMHYLPITDSMGSIIAVEGILRDISESKLLEEQLKNAELSKQNLLENISHEIRTPITLIQGYTESLLNNVVPIESTSTYLKMIHSKARVLTNLLEDLIQVAHFTSQTLEYKYYERNAKEFFDNLINQCEFQITQTNHTFYKNISIINDSILILDPYRIEQVVSNLINNAIRHTTLPGSISISCQTYPNEELIHAVQCNQPIDLTIPDGELVFMVSDTGDGIPTEDLPHIFERKFSGKNRINYSTVKNTGLGLFISMQIIKHHSGRMWAKNNEATGASLSFSLPYYLDK